MNVSQWCQKGGGAKKLQLPHSNQNMEVLIDAIVNKMSKEAHWYNTMLYIISYTAVIPLRNRQILLKSPIRKKYAILRENLGLDQAYS